jgi:hypothetical protein
MLEAVFYTCLGGTCSALLLIGFVFFMKQPEEKKKKESLSPESCALMLVLYVPAFLIMGPFMLSLSVSFASELLNEWKAFSILNDKSKVLTVPLIDIRREAVIHNTLHYASYEYGGASHEQEISKAQYRQLENKSSVDIRTNGNISRITGTQPPYSSIPNIFVTGTIGLISTWIVIEGKVQRLRSYILSRLEYKQKRKPKRGL